MIMVLSTTVAIAGTGSASIARSYTTQKDPLDIAIADFNCDGHNDMAIATDGTHTITVLWNDGNGDFSERSDIWVSGNNSRRANWDEFSNVQEIEVGEFTGDSAPDIVIYQRNNPFKTDDSGAPAGEPGNATIIENDGCSTKSFSVGARFTHFWVWDLKVGDFNGDGNDDVAVLDLLADIDNQRVVVYNGPVTSSSQGQITALGSARTNSYRAFDIGDWGESQPSPLGSCFDEDLWLLRSEGVDYSTGQTTNPGKDDNVTIIEYNCNTNSFPTTFTFNQQSPPINSHVVTMNNDFGGFDIGDSDNDGVIDVIAQTDGNVENVTYVTSSAVGTWSAKSNAYFGPYIAYEVTVADINGDGEPDFASPTVAYQLNSSDSAGGSSSSYYLNFPTTVQVTLSDGSGGHVNPLSYQAGRRPSMVAVGQLAGGSSSAVDLAVGHTSYNFGSWVDNFGWEGQYDTITVVEMDNKDLSVTGLEISPVDRAFGIAGEGTRDLNVTVTNTGMDILNGQSATLDVELKIVDEANSTNTTVYSNDFDGNIDATNCPSCVWEYYEYIDGATQWHLESNQSTGATTEGNNAPNVSANYINPSDFMWAGNYKTNSSGDVWSGYDNNWDDSMVLENVDLTGSDRAFMAVDLFRHLGFGALGSSDGQGFIVQDVWDDLAIVEVGSVETGWSVIGCPNQARLDGACPSGSSIWGGFDGDRAAKAQFGAAPENIVYYGVWQFGTYYGWDNFTEQDLGAFDLSQWAGETVDVRFRFRTGFEGSTSDTNESRWSGRDGFAVDDIEIWKQTTSFFPNPQTQQVQINLNNLAPGEEYTTSASVNLVNDTTYRVSASLSNNAWDEQPLNDELVGYLTPFNLYDPAMEGYSTFLPGQLYAEGIFDIEVQTNNWGNTPVDFQINSTVSSATPSDVYCGTPSAVCEETFEGGSEGYRYSDDGNPQGAVYDESACTDKIFNSHGYWFGHPCDTANNGYTDDWANETMSIPDIDLTSMSGDFVSLNFEYYADTFYTIGVDGTSIEDVNDYVALTADYSRDGTDYNAVIFGQWNDYNDDGTCQVDENGDGIVNATEPLDQIELDFIGDPSTTDGTGGNYNVFFNTDGLVSSISLDLTHLYVLNTTSASSLDWTRECISLAGSTVSLNFEFQSDDDGRNGENDGFLGVGFNNITLEEFTFTEDATYTVTRTNVDAEEVASTIVGSHEFTAGVYRIETELFFDNTTVGKPWFGDNEVSVANNIERVLFRVESVDISLGRPEVLSCMNDESFPCTLPIDSSLTHDWSFFATNGVLAGDYTFHMNVEDITDSANPTDVHSTTSGPSQTLDSQERVEVSFTPWNGWQDGHTYNISYYATLSDGSESGNVRYFHATFADKIDIAILSDDSSRVNTIKDDMEILGMTYTLYEIKDWNEYLDGGWMTHYDKIILPWQSSLAARDIDDGGKGYYQALGNTQNRQILEGFMQAGGTVQMHLAPHGSAIYGLDQGLEGRLPFGIDVQNRDTPETSISYADMNLQDPYHPLMDNVEVSSFQGFTVANAVVNTKSVSATAVPMVCNGYSENGGYFQRIISDADDNQDTVLGVCSYYNGGLILSTIDVATVSQRADSSTFPLLGNMLDYQVTPYPTGFGTLGNGLDLKINDENLAIDPSTGGYALRYMKSNAELTFSYTTTTTETLTANWVLDGPTTWNGEATTGTSTQTGDTVTSTFCQVDLSEATGCRTDAEWNVQLILHDAAGHSRTIDVNVRTNDVYADEFRPTASAVVITDGQEDVIEKIDTKTVSDVEWDVYQITMDDTGAVQVNFDASDSSDQDAIDGSGIETYEWKVLYDAPYGDDSFDLQGHTFTEGAASNGDWTYIFSNVTSDSTGEVRNQIRVELIVFDGAGKFSDKFRFYFEVVPEGYGDEEPVVQIDTTLNGSQFTSDTLTITGNVISGAETQQDVYVEIAFDEDNFNANPLDKYTYQQEGIWAKTTDGLSDGDSFELTLDMDGFYSNISQSQNVYIKIYEEDPADGRGERWVTIKFISLQLPACQGLQADAAAIEAGGEFVIVDGECVWEGVWSYDPETGEWTPPASTGDGNEGDGGLSTTVIAVIAGIGGLLLVGIILFFLRGGSTDEKDFVDLAGAGFGAAQLDPVEQYVQQLIAQGYPEDTARAYAQQNAAQLGLASAASAAPAQAAAPAGSGNAMYDQYYAQYYQQFVAQGYDAATAQQYAAQYAQQALQQQ